MACLAPADALCFNAGMSWKTRLTKGIPPPAIFATFMLGALGGGVFSVAGMPLGMLLGSLITVGLVSALGLNLGSHPPAVPQHWRFFMIPIVGVAIGASFTPELASQAWRWWPALAALVLYVPLIHTIAYLIYRRFGRQDVPTAYFAAMPGGFIEALEMGEAERAEMQMLIMLQFLRLILCIVLVPIVFALVSGQAVGTGSGISRPGEGVPIRLWDATVMLGCAGLGWWGAKRLNLPAAVLSGPLALSALAHMTGLTAATPPDGAILFAQWVVGTALGTRFTGMERAKLALALRLSLANTVAAFAVAGALAAILTGWVQEPVSALILGFAPGGISELSLVALSLQLSVVFVTLVHLVRIVLTVIFARVGWRLLQSQL